MLLNSGTITGGVGASYFGSGGNGGVGAEFLASAAVLTNLGTIAGGDGGGGTSPGNIGEGGAGVIGADLTIINGGQITGGLSGDGLTRADAIDFTGGVNSLTLLAGSNIIGNVAAFSAADMLVLGGSTNGSFNVSEIGATAQYEGFGVFEKTGSSTWTLTGSTTAVTPWAIEDGTLAVSADSNLGAASGAVSFGGGTLEFLSSFTTSRAFVLAAGGGAFDTDGNDVTIQGLISGSGGLTKVGAGELTVLGTNIYSGGTSLTGGTLDLAAIGAAGTGGITFVSNDAILKIENAALSAQAFGNPINDFDRGDSIDLPGLAFAPGATASFDNKSDILSVTSGGITDTLTLRNPEFGKFLAISDGGGGTEVVEMHNGPPDPPAVVTLHANDTFVFASSLSQGAGASSNDHNDAIAPHHSDWAELAAMLADAQQAAAPMANELIHDFTSDHVSTGNLHTHSFLL
jgi:autotransporter-associated beta strand protein